MAETLDELWKECEAYGRWEPDYYDRMVHPIPDADVIERERWILEQCLDKTVLHFGCNGLLHKGIEDAANEAWGVDKDEGDASHFIKLDLDSPDWDLPDKDWEIIICGEVLEHLSNPGLFLDKLRAIAHCPVVFTAPNAFTSIGEQYIKSKPPKENVNVDHVAYYSYHTLRNLLIRHGFTPTEFHWCCCWQTVTNKPLTSEGLAFVAE